MCEFWSWEVFGVDEEALVRLPWLDCAGLITISESLSLSLSLSLSVSVDVSLDNSPAMHIHRGKES